MIRRFGLDWFQPQLLTDQMVFNAAVKQLLDVGLAGKLIMVQGGVMFHSGMATAVKQKLFNEIRTFESIPDQSYDWNLPESIPLQVIKLRISRDLIHAISNTVASKLTTSDASASNFAVVQTGSSKPSHKVMKVLYFYFLY